MTSKKETKILELILFTLVSCLLTSSCMIGMFFILNNKIWIQLFFGIILFMCSAVIVQSIYLIITITKEN